MTLQSGDIPRLTTERTVLRALTLGDFEASAALWADEAVTRYFAPLPLSREESGARFRQKVGQWPLLGFGFWAVTDRVTGAFIGEAGFAENRRAVVPSFEGEPEAGWVFAPSVHGKGIATEVMSRIAAWADETIGAETTVCMFDPAHEASRRVAEKVGYTVRGEARFRDEPVLVMERKRR